MPFVVATCTKTYAGSELADEVIDHKDEDLSVPIESEETAVQFAIEAVKMQTLLYDLAGEKYHVIPNGPLLVVATATRQVAFGIKVF